MTDKLTEQQLSVIEKLESFAENFADAVYKTMVDHGLNRIPGFRIGVNVDPQYQYITRRVLIGYYDTPSGHVTLNKGKGMDKFVVSDTNSAEYEQLFAEQKATEGKEYGGDQQKPFPPDGLWVGTDHNPNSVDGWEWDVNDSLS